jgi:Membrane fusion protein Use1
MALDTATVLVSSTRAEQDDVYWTELEFRRLGNMVAEMIQARRYVGDDVRARNERALMRTRVDAMRRKALRVLARAELYAKSSHGAWPGLDSSLTEPISLAEEYVRTVSNYDAVLTEEEDRARRAIQDDFDVGGVRAAAAAMAVACDGDGGSGEDIGDDVAGFGGVDDMSYREALARDAADLGNADTRDDLAGARMRRRSIASVQKVAGATGRYSEADENLMAAHQPVQDQLTNDLVDLVGRLKGSMTEINARITQDGHVIDETEDALDKNITSIGKHRENLGHYSRYTSLSWWTIYALIVLVVVVFIAVFALTKIPI